MHAALHLVLAQTQAAQDTVISIPHESALRQAVSIAELGLLILAYLLLGAIVVLAIRMKDSVEKAKASLDDVGGHLRDIADNAERITESVSAVAKSVQLDVASVHDTVQFANSRARRAVGELADRVDEFNAALGVIQDTAKGGIISAIAAISGVKAGVSALRRKPKRGDTPRRARELGERPPDLPARPRLRRRAHGDR